MMVESKNKDATLGRVPRCKTGIIHVVEMHNVRRKQ